jgi:benzoyl-CoA reductase/2-hydroxyglutaryl-CoA dehydratase subunit BcrC/BadD/HgdB
MESILSTPVDEPFPYKAYFLEKKDEDGKKFVGVLAHEMVPLEILRASGLQVVPLIFVGPEEYSSTGGALMTHSTCSFARNIVGGFIQGDIGFYKDIKLLIRTNYCNGDFIGAEYLCKEFHLDCVDLFFPVKTREYSLALFRDQLVQFTEKLGKKLGITIEESEIVHQVTMHNAMREALRRLAGLGIRGLELLQRYQEAAVLTPAETCERLDRLYFKNNEFLDRPKTQDNEPNILLTGDPLFVNDFFAKSLEEFGANITYYDTWIGARMAEFTVDEQDIDVFHALARSYLLDQGLDRTVPAATEKKIAKVEAIIASNNIHGVINHTLKFCDFLAIGRGTFKDQIGRLVPVLDIERDYAQSGIGGIKTRVEAFIELVKGGI